MSTAPPSAPHTRLSAKFYALLVVGKTISCLPYWIIKSIIPSTRRHRNWTAFQSVLNDALFTFWNGFVGLGFAPVPGPYKHTLAQEQDAHIVLKDDGKTKGVWIPPADTKYLHGEAKIRKDVIPVTFRGYVWNRKGESGYKAAPGETVWLMLHGGGYMSQSGRPDDVTAIQAPTLLSHSKITRVLSIDYRIAQTAPWPAQLVDAVSAYTFLIDTCGYAPENIVIGGESAGAALTHALMRYIIDSASSDVPLPKPAGVLLNSVWADLSPTGDKPPNGIDFLRIAALGPVVRPYLRGDYTSLGATPSFSFESPYLSAHFAEPQSFAAWPPTLITTGDLEVLHEDNIKLFQAMKAGGADVSLQVGKDGEHNYFTQLSVPKENRELAWNTIGAFVDKVMRPKTV